MNPSCSAAAGLDQLEKTDWVRERLEPKDFCPAAGQGALGIGIRKGDQATLGAIAFLNDPGTRFAVTVERAASAALGRRLPVPSASTAGRGLLEAWERVGEAEQSDEVFGVVAAPTTGAAVRIFHRAPRGSSSPEALGQLAARMLLDAGAGPLPRPLPRLSVECTSTGGTPCPGDPFGTPGRDAQRGIESSWC